MKKTKYLSVIAVITGLLLMHSCNESFLEITPNGALDVSVLATYEGVDALLIGAYSMIDGYDAGIGAGWEAASSGWVYGSIRGMESNKGTDSGDQPDINPLQTYSETASNPYLNFKWRACYEGISRCNSTIVAAMAAETAGTITLDEATSFYQQAKALRGVYHFWAWKMWADRSSNTFVPYVDETTDQSTLTNTDDIRTKIIEDLTAGTNLPTDMKQIGRFNKTVCQVFLAKAQMQMFGNYSAALALLENVESSGTNPAGGEIGLMDLYGDIFDASKRNEKEAVYTVQYSVNDNSGGWNAGRGEVLNFPYKSGLSPGGCCGFFNPTQDFVNSFRTDAGGLPFLDNSYNDEEVTSDQGIAIDAVYITYPGQLDPRLDWSAGRRGIPYWDWGPHTGQDWIRDQSYSGPYSPKKQVYKQSQEGTLTEVGNWTSGYTANGYRMIRYADVLLLKAECEAMTTSGDLGFGEVNMIRARAANTDGFVMLADGVTPAANYVINVYPGADWGAVDPMTAIKFERKIELGQEGHRYYDLQRWGDVQTELTRILTYEREMPWGGLLYGSASIGPEDVNFPIPQRQIDVTNGKLIQNR
ncbi:MAG: RagB/SusD family nutrient uptake outer membrane protein [Bacteroidales bacterium]|nr:RagB/SusD family nutrient uptake outer membrane protein [Bacteroidales bacterium]